MYQDSSQTIKKPKHRNHDSILDMKVEVAKKFPANTWKKTISHPVPEREL